MSDPTRTQPEPDARERAAIATVVAGIGAVDRPVGERVVHGGPRAAAARRHLLLPGLWALQDAVGWISPGGLHGLASVLGVPDAEAYGVATFYDLLATEAPPVVVVRRCDDLACRIGGAAAADLATPRSATEVGSPCLGRCDHGGAALVQRTGAPLTVVVPTGTIPTVDAGPVGRLLGRVLDDPCLDLAGHTARGGLVALGAARAMAPASIRSLVRDAGLRGRGGAAFPTGVKWDAVAAEPGPRHLVANADESEPGTFKDRVLMERDPFAVIESLAIAAHAVEAEHVWIYVRGEYPLAAERLGAALDALTAAGHLDGLTVEIRRGAGAYICGEETALLESIEGYRGEPRSKPPYPTTFGLFGRPTAINNVETLVNVRSVVTEGAAAWRTVGTADSPGTRLFCLSGHVARPGVYERPMGVRLGDLIADAGGVARGRELQAVLLGGAAGVLVGPDRLDVELSFEGAAAAGVTLGSGVVMLFDDTTDLPDVVRRAAAFFAHESCGQCVPCRVGTQRQVEALAGATADAGVLDDLDRVMTDASICGLGQSAAALVRSARRLGVW